jgi:hypothetical protein
MAIRQSDFQPAMPSSATSHAARRQGGARAEAPIEEGLIIADCRLLIADC